MYNFHNDNHLTYPAVLRAKMNLAQLKAVQQFQIVKILALTLLSRLTPNNQPKQLFSKPNSHLKKRKSTATTLMPTNSMLVLLVKPSHWR